MSPLCRDHYALSRRLHRYGQDAGRGHRRFELRLLREAECRHAERVRHGNRPAERHTDNGAALQCAPAQPPSFVDRSHFYAIGCPHYVDCIRRLMNPG